MGHLFPKHDRNSDTFVAKVNGEPAVIDLSGVPVDDNNLIGTRLDRLERVAWFLGCIDSQIGDGLWYWVRMHDANNKFKKSLVRGYWLRESDTDPALTEGDRVIATRDRHGRWAFVTFFSKYEVFADAGTNYTSISQDTGNGTPGTFSLYESNGGADEVRVLVHSDFVYGATRKIERVVFDIVHQASDWQRQESVDDDMDAGATTAAFDAGLYVGIKPILEDFDPATIDWAGGTALSVGNEALYNVALMQEGVLSCTLDGTDPADMANATCTLSGEWPLLMTVRRELTNALDWNDQVAIYGFQIRVACDGASDFCSWTGTPDADVSQAYVIRA
ncbi:MAG: hypothetical protein WC683_05750 [bacterium]